MRRNIWTLPPPKPRRSSKRRATRPGEFMRLAGVRRTWTPWLLIAPTALFALLVTVAPLGYSVVASLRQFPLGHAPVFVGLQNYRELLRDCAFQGSLSSNMIITVGATAYDVLL